MGYLGYNLKEKRDRKRRWKRIKKLMKLNCGEQKKEGLGKIGREE